MLRGVFEGGWRKFRGEEFRDLFSLPNIITQIKARRLRWMGHVTLVTDMGRAEDVKCMMEMRQLGHLM